MAWLAVLIVVVGALIALMIMRVPHRTVRLMEEAETRKMRIAALDTRLARLSEMRSQARLLFEGATSRDAAGLDPDDIEILNEMRAACKELMAGLHEESPILERYFQNHIAVLDYVLSGPDEKSSLSEKLRAALSDLERSQAAEHSAHPIAVLERQLATGRGAS